MFRFIACLICAACFLQGQASWACTIAPAHMYLPHDDAIDDAEWIVVAEAVRRTTEELEYTAGLRFTVQGYEMRVIEYVKGTGPDLINISNRDERAAKDHSKEAGERNFYGHAVSSFWMIGGDNSNWPDCSIHPGFLFAGHRYLIFGPKDYQNGFENITLDGDVWLQYVRDYVDGKAPDKPFPVSTADYFEKAKAIVRVQAAWDGTSARWSMDILKGPEKNYMHMINVSPSAAFDVELNPACERPFSEAPQAETIDRLYVFERMPDKEISITQGVDCIGEKLDDWGRMSARGVFAPNSYQVLDVVDGYVQLPQGWVPDFALLNDAEEDDTLKLDALIASFTP